MNRRTRKTTQKVAPARGSGRSGTRELEHRLLGILGSLAKLLISSGYGVSSLNAMIRRAYVDAASSLQTEGGRPITNARIAALTGLTRTEVTRLLRNRGRLDQSDKVQVDRAKRVTEGWIKDSAFKDSYGRPKVLPFKEGRPSFDRLVKDYSGDIPARAMLAEMERLRLVRVMRRNGKDFVQLSKKDAPIARRTLQSVRTIQTWVNSLVSLNGSLASDIETSTKQIDLNFSSLPQARSAIRELEKRRRAFEQTIEELGAEKFGTEKFQLSIFVALAAALPKHLGANLSPTRRGR